MSPATAAGVETQNLRQDLTIPFLTEKTVLVREGISAQGDASMPEFNPAPSDPIQRP